MSDSNVAVRLKTFIEKKGLSYSQFADMCGIPRPSLSQLLTGRNKKISDIMVGQIHNMFPELSIVWLLFGEGPMENERREIGENRVQKTGTIFDDELIGGEIEGAPESKKIFFPGDGQQRSGFSKENGLNGVANLSQDAEMQIEKLQNRIKELQTQIERIKKNPRKVAHITVYYEDSTFETFFPQ
ncbi:MAG: helix-turn-helix transcriptional regulator [Muribaculaceae bacterium]|nr:helix-turn-helix transcriptional regulator [Muribaculaceae bacterium]